MSEENPEGDTEASEAPEAAEEPPGTPPNAEDSEVKEPPAAPQKEQPTRSRLNSPFRKKSPKISPSGGGTEKRHRNTCIESIDRSKEPKNAFDSLDTEYVFYETTLKLLVQGLPDNCLRKNLKKWITKLFGAEYSSSLFKEKRNRYLCSLCLSLMNDDLTGVFSSPPPEGALIEVADVEVVDSVPAAWELSEQWEQNMEHTANLPPLFSKTPCNVHKEDDEVPENRQCPDLPETTSFMLDEEFQFYMFLARPYISLMPVADDRVKAAAWIMLLCTVGPKSCPVMKCVRNDYMKALLGCVGDLSVRGLFAEFPRWGQLVPLGDAAERAARMHPVTDPKSRESDDFLKEQKIPNTGAFCYMTISGELVSSNVLGLKKALDKSKSATKRGLTSLSMSLSGTGPYPKSSTPHSALKKKPDDPEVTEIYKNKTPSTVKFKDGEKGEDEEADAGADAAADAETPAEE